VLLDEGEVLLVDGGRVKLVSVAEGSTNADNDGCIRNPRTKSINVVDVVKLKLVAAHDGR